MNALQEPRFLFPGTIVGNPLVAPREPLISIEKVRKGFFGGVDEILSENDLSAIQAQSSIGAHTMYDFFDNRTTKNTVHIGAHLVDVILRIHPKDEPEETTIKMLSGENFYDIAIVRGFLQQVSYGEALLNIANMIIELNVDTTNDFDDRCINQLDVLREQIEDSGLLDHQVMQVTQHGYGYIVGLPQHEMEDDDGIEDESTDSDFSWEDIGEFFLPSPEPVTP